LQATALSPQDLEPAG
ncbi:hypothetical protein HaLaN_29161, partial [Haematococcus lacustris]